MEHFTQLSGVLGAMAPPVVRLTERFDQAVLPMVVLALDVTMIEVNEACCRLLALPRERLVGRPFEDITADGRGEEHARAVQEAVLAGEVGGQIERKLSTADATVLDVQVAWTLVRDEQGDPSYGTLVLVDVTDRRRSEAALARSEARFRARFEQSSVPQTRVGLDGSLTAVNDAFCALIGCGADELLGRSLISLTHPQDAGQAQSELTRLLAGEVDSARYERLVTDAEGRALPTLVDITLLRDADGHPDEAASIVYDLRGLRDLERHREQQERFFLAVSQHASDVALVADAEGQILFASAATRDATSRQSSLRGWAGSSCIPTTSTPRRRSTNAWSNPAAPARSRRASARPTARGDGSRRPSRTCSRPPSEASSPTCATSPNGWKPSRHCGPRRRGTEPSPRPPRRASGPCRPTA
jgi:PAS domain S-box-containing protein